MRIPDSIFLHNFGFKHFLDTTFKFFPVQSTIRGKQITLYINPRHDKDIYFYFEYEIGSRFGRLKLPCGGSSSKALE